MDQTLRQAVSKVPEVTLGFWVIKVIATTLGETGGDAVTMTLGLGYLVGTAIFAALFIVAVAAQIRARRFHPFLYWAVIVATTDGARKAGVKAGRLAKGAASALGGGGGGKDDLAQGGGSDVSAIPTALAGIVAELGA